MKRISIFNLAAALILSLAGCSSNPVETNRDVVIICDAENVYQPRWYYTEDKEKGPYMMTLDPVIFTVRNAVCADSVMFIKKVTADTLTIENEEGRLAIHYNYNPIGELDFIVNAGDSVLIEKIDGIPYLTILNRPDCASVNYDRDRMIRDTTIYGYRLETMASHPHVLSSVCYSRGIRDYDYLRAERKRIHELTVSYLKKESHRLDSLYAAGKIDELEHSFFKERNLYKRLGFELNYLEKEAFTDILKEYSDSLYRNDIFGFYGKYMNNIVAKAYFTDYIRHSNGSDLDYKKTFDKISNDTLLHGLLKDDNLYRCFRNIADDRSHAEGKLYYEKLLATAEDKGLLEKVAREYGEKFSVTVEVKDDLELLSSQGDTLMFKDLRKSLSGKVLYVDIWASWCEPCKREMPHSNELSEDYSDDDVVFLYLALNDTKDKWEKAVETIGLNEIGKSYLVLNSKDNSWTKDMNVSTVPRYMIYDRKGNLVNSNAPRPSSNEIRNELDMLITSRD